VKGKTTQDNIRKTQNTKHNNELEEKKTCVLEHAEHRLHPDSLQRTQ
jgi:hypothetical protein